MSTPSSTMSNPGAYCDTYCDTYSGAYPVPVSMLDLVAVREGRSVGNSLAVSLRTAQHAESLGFTRYWLAEHHNMAGIASSATAVLVGHIAGVRNAFG